MKQQSAAAGTRLNLIAMRARIAATQVVNLQHVLNKQFLRDDPQTQVNDQVYTVPLETLAQDYEIGVTGATEPIDSVTRRQEYMTLFEIAMKVPFVSQSAAKVYRFFELLLESFGRKDIPQLIGSLEEAQAFDQQQAQARQMQMQAMQAQAQQGGHPPQGGPPQGQRPPQQGMPPR